MTRHEDEEADLEDLIESGEVAFVPDRHAGRVLPQAHDVRAPFRERLADGSMGNDYFPDSPRTGQPVSHDRAERDWRDRRAAGSLWDHTAEAKMGTRRRGGRGGQPARSDSERMLGFIEKHAAELGARTVEVALMFWRRGQSYGSIAAELRHDVTGEPLSRHSVRTLIQRLRWRVARNQG